MLQKNKMFMPGLLVVPVGSSVAFPNADPFFHNVFSLFDGRATWNATGKASAGN